MENNIPYRFGVEEDGIIGNWYYYFNSFSCELLVKNLKLKSFTKEDIKIEDILHEYMDNNNILPPGAVCYIGNEKDINEYLERLKYEIVLVKNN